MDLRDALQAPLILRMIGKPGSTGRALAIGAAVAFAWFVVSPLIAAEVEAKPRQWSAPRTLADGDHVSGPLLTFLPDGSSTLAWTRENGTVRIADRLAGGEFVMSDEIVGPPADQFEARDLTSNASGTSALLTSTKNRLVERLQVRIRPPGGGFEEPVTIAGTAGSIGRPQIGLGPDGTLIATWSEDQGAGPQAVFAWVKAPADDFATTTKLGEGTLLERGTSASTGPDGTTTVIWSKSAGGEQVISSRTRAPGGAFGPVHQIETGATPDSQAAFSQVQVDGDGRSSVYWGCDGLCYADRHPDGTWSPVQTVTTTGIPAILGFDVDTNSDGTAIAVWPTEGGVVAAKRPAGGSFIPPETVAEEPGHRPLVSLEPDGSASVFWWGPMGGIRPASVPVRATYSDSTGNFATPVTVGSAYVTKDVMWMASGPGGTTAFWIFGNYGPTEIALADRSPEGFSRSSLSDTPGMALSPRVGFASGSLTIWQQENTGLPTIEVRSRFPADTEVTNADTLTGAATDPDLDFHGGFRRGAAAVWVREPGFVQGAVSEGESFSHRVTLSEGALEDPEPSVAISPQGLATAVWRGWRTATVPAYETVESVDFNSSGPSGSSEALSAPHEKIGRPQIASGRTGATTAVVWEGGFDGHQIRAAIRRPGRDFSAPVTVSPPSVPGSEPAVAVGTGGQVFVAWKQSGNPARIRVAVSHAGNDFSEPMAPPRAGAVASGPRLASGPSGRYMLAWRQANGKISVASGTEAPLNTQVVSGSSITDFGPALSVGPEGLAAVAWRTSDGEIEVTSSTQSGAFDPVVKVSSRAAPVDPDVAVTTAGRTQVVWVEETGKVAAALGSGQTLDCPKLRRVAFKGVRRKAARPRELIRLRTWARGTLRVIANGRLKRSSVRSSGRSAAPLPLLLRRAAARRLNRTGQLAVTVRVRFQPGNLCQPVTRTYRLKLKRR